MLDTPNGLWPHQFDSTERISSMNPNPAQLSDMPCSWQLCNVRIPEHHRKTNLWLCQEHALYVWSVIDEQIKESQLDIEAIRERDRTRAEQGVAQEEAWRRSRERQGHVYYLRVGPHIKIGFATELRQRLLAYPPGTELLAVEQGTLRDEGLLHKRFAHLRAAGREWYHPRPQLMEHIRATAENCEHMIYDGWQKRVPVVENEK